MLSSRTRGLVLVLLALLLALAAAGCGRERPQAETATGPADTGAFEEEALSGRVRADGSSTVAPLVSLAAERFRKQEPGVKVTVGISGTGGGFERFCRGETDLSNASRKIEADEIANCKKKRIDYLELQVANDGLSVVVNKSNDWAKCLTVEQLKKMWQPGSKVKNWMDVDPSFPDQKLTLYGPGTDSGTFDYFTGAIVGEEGASRTDYSASEDDNVIVRGVEGEKGALGYFGLSYYESNKNRLRAVEIDGGDGCVAPSVETAQDGEYKPLSRPLFVYVKKESLARPEVAAFVKYVLDNETEIAKASQFVPLTTEQLEKGRADFEAATKAS
jgi:phosphate transport system substrate-binding protein